MPIYKSIQAQSSLWKYFHIFQEDKPNYPNTLLLYLYSSLSSYPGSATIYRNEDKEKTDEDEEEEEEVKGMYILLSGILAVVKSAVRVL